MFKFIDLFCGVGGFHQAFLKIEHDTKENEKKTVQFKCNLACDTDKHCRKVYSDNYGIEPESDVRKIERIRRF